MAGGGYIKLYRSMLDWGWYGNVNTKIVFLHLLLTANYEDGACEGRKIPRGSAVCSQQGLAATLNLTVQQVRTALEHLKNTGEITITRASKFLVVTVVNYDDYQGDQQSLNNQSTINQQSLNNHLTTSKEIKNKRNKEYKNKPAAKGNEGASYDIEKAVADATANVPTIRKRATGKD